MISGRTGLAAILLCLCVAAAHAQSVYTARPDDPLAAYLTAADFGAHGDGLADDTDALQHAIDRVQQTTHHGVVFIPAGRYRLTRTVHVWAGIRLIGYGRTRPVFLLAPNTPGFGPDHITPPSIDQEFVTPAAASRYMLWFTDERPPSGQPIGDASEFTFFSALSNIDFEIGAANPAAVAIRFNVAQHSFISHANFHLRSGYAAIEQIGNQASDIHVHGGSYGIITGKTSPAWQFLLMDSSFDGQRSAAISTHDAGFTLVRVRIADTPIAIQIPHGEVEQLYARDLTLSNIAQTAFSLGDVKNFRSEITLENIACEHVHHFLEGLQDIADASAIPGPSLFIEDHFSLGLDVGPDGREGGIHLHHHEVALSHEPPDVATDIPTLPAMETWVNVHTLGAKGDGATDDTAALQHAIDTHQTLYFPSGFYRLTASLHLRPDTVLIGFNPFSTELVLNNADPHLQGSGPAIPMLIAPHNGTNIVTGFGIATGNANPRAAGIEWLAGPHSMLEDVDFIRGHSEFVAALEPAAPKPAAQRDPMQLDAQYPALWIHNGGGGILRGIWSHGGTAHAGLLIENTSAPGTIYQFSCEHHMRHEVRIDHASNWTIYDLQTEEEKPEGADADAIELTSAHDLLFANTYMYRVSRNTMPKLYAVVAHNSANITFANVKVFSQTRLAFDNTVLDQGSGVAVRAHDFTHFALTNTPPHDAPLPLPPAFASNATLAKLATGFSNASGLTADSTGTIFFTDAANHTIYRYDPAQHTATVLAKTDGSPQVLAFVAPSSLLAINNEKSISRIDVTTGALIDIPATMALNPDTLLLLPVGLHNQLAQLTWMLAHEGFVFRTGSNTARRSDLQPEPRSYFYAPNSTSAIMAGGTWRPLLQSSQLAPFSPGDRHYIASEDDAQTWSAQLSASEALTTQLFAERGGTSVVSDTAGNVYIAGSQLFVYDRNGHQIGTLEIPERPSSLCFGGPDHRTLFIGARASLYAIEAVAPGH